MITDSAWDIKKIYKFLAKENIALFSSTNVRREVLNFVGQRLKIHF